MTRDSPSGLFDLYRRPLASPLATLVATAILLAFAYQGYVLAQGIGPLGYVLVAGTAAVAYGVAKCGWAVENEIVRDAQEEYRYDATAFDGDPSATEGRE